MTQSDQFHSNPFLSNGTSLTEAQHLAWTISESADSRKAREIVLLEVTDVCYLADYFIIMTGDSRTQLKAISDAIRDQVEETLNYEPVRIEGEKERNWILLDYGDVITHIMLPEQREFYDIESFWGHAKRFDFQTLQQTSAG